MVAVMMFSTPAGPSNCAVLQAMSPLSEIDVDKEERPSLPACTLNPEPDTTQLGIWNECKDYLDFLSLHTNFNSTTPANIRAPYQGRREVPDKDANQACDLWTEVQRRHT